MNKTALIFHHREDEICFLVDDVEKCQEQLPAQALSSQFEQRFGKSALAFSHDKTCLVVQAGDNHPLVSAVHCAFSNHYPLLLTPDTIWITLAQGFAHHVNNHAKTLRPRFVSHQGKISLQIKATDLSQPDNWAEAVNNWAQNIRQHVGQDLYQNMVCNFSTTTPITRTVSQIAMMESFRQYFDFAIMCICGIPSITLQGTVDDWRGIVERVKWMETYELAWWTQRLLPICEEFVKTAEGEPTLEFWQHIYKPESIYGDKLITGWLADLFPYVNDRITKMPTHQNPILKKNRKKLTVKDGISPASLPFGLSKAEFTLEDMLGAKHYMELLGGFIGVEQHPQSGVIQPVIGWAVQKQDSFSQLLEELAPEHQSQSSVRWSRAHSFVPKELIQAMERLNGVTLFAQSDHPWHIRKVQTIKTYWISNSNEIATSFIDLKDGRCIAYGRGRSYGGLVIISELAKMSADVKKNTGALSALGLDKELISVNIRVIAKGVKAFFECIADAKGEYFFDSPDFKIPDLAK